jgi:circadian clock protein KaiB
MTRHGLQAEAEPPGAGADPGHYSLRLYVTDRTGASAAAIENLTKACEEHMPGHYDIEVIDLRQHPRLAIIDQIFAVPTLIRRVPPSRKRIVGTLTSAARLLSDLDIPARPPAGCFAAAAP